MTPTSLTNAVLVIARLLRDVLGLAAEVRGPPQRQAVGLRGCQPPVGSRATLAIWVSIEIDDHGAALVVAAQPRGLRERCVSGRPVGLAPARLVGRERAEDRLFEQQGVLTAAQQLPGAGRRSSVARDSATGA